eukprot:g1335.t1
MLVCGEWLLAIDDMDIYALSLSSFMYMNGKMGKGSQKQSSRKRPRFLEYPPDAVKIVADSDNLQEVQHPRYLQLVNDNYLNIGRILWEPFIASRFRQMSVLLWFSCPLDDDIGFPLLSMASRNRDSSNSDTLFSLLSITLFPNRLVIEARETKNLYNAAMASNGTEKEGTVQKKISAWLGKRQKPDPTFTHEIHFTKPLQSVHDSTKRISKWCQFALTWEWKALTSRRRRGSGQTGKAGLSSRNPSLAFYLDGDLFGNVHIPSPSLPKGLLFPSSSSMLASTSSFSTRLAWLPTSKRGNSNKKDNESFDEHIFCSVVGASIDVPRIVSTDSASRESATPPWSIQKRSRDGNFLFSEIKAFHRVLSPLELKEIFRS